MATDTKSESVPHVNGANNAQVVDSIFATVGASAAPAAKQVPAKPMPKVEMPVMVPARPARVRRPEYVEMEPAQEPAEETSTWRDWIGKALVVGGVVCAAYFPLKATPGSLLCDQPARSTVVASRTPAGPRVVTEDIQYVNVGDRIMGRNPLREQVDPTAPEPDAKTWRKLVLRMTKQSGRHLNVNLLRPVEWIDDAGAKADGTFLNLPEMGAVGNADVDAIEPCPTMERGQGNVVTGTFHHEADPDTVILQVDFSNGLFLKGVTDNHPFWSEDRQGFVAVGELKKGERVRMNDGITTVSSVSSRLAYPGEMLYNLETHNEHVYQVTTAGILVHNSCARLPKPGTPERTAIEAARARGIRAAKAQELANIKAGGKGSGVWTEAELQQIRQTGKFPSDVRWHHDPTVANQPDLAADPGVIQPIRGGVRGHLDAHGGDFRQ